MAHVFEGRPGRVTVVEDPLDAPLAVRLDTLGSALAFRAVVTGIALQQECNVQFLHSYADLVYAFIFGDRLAPLQISGLAFADTCGSTGAGGALGLGGRSGFEQVLEFWAANRAAVRAVPAQLQLGATAAGSFQGLLVGMTGQLTDSELRLGRFALTYRTLPRSRS